MQGRQGQAPRRGGGGSGSAAPRPVNYNDLMLHGASPPSAESSTRQPVSQDARRPPPTVFNGSRHRAPAETPGACASQGAAAPGAERTAPGYLVARSEVHTESRPLSSSFSAGVHGSGGGSPESSAPRHGAGFLEGPLPPEVRQLIESSCRSQGHPTSVQDEAERQARRLLSTTRRVKVYREELQAAMAESSDLEGVLDRQRLVTRALHGEIEDIDAQIARLLQEKQLCEAQLNHEEQIAHYQEAKLSEAQERVNVLRNTVENISAESHRGQLVLRQLVPNLNIDNYT